MTGQQCLFGSYVLTGLFASEPGRAGRVLILGSNGRVRQTLRGKGVGRLRAQSWRTLIVGIAGGGDTAGARSGVARPSKGT